ncbi:hypothetical protein EVAR_55039_1 [Eumeta japonica]|uniref:Uncharacterized protein n=1 Tax=Eumeta variegata TaxID=151549 RepID=A0A4C1ZUK2_EUMVA|nr:hypothetical protein EVAR_55039_1 [Eumeta japonica]
MWDQAFPRAGPHDSWRPRGRITGSGHWTPLPFLCGASLRIPGHTPIKLERCFGFLSVLGTARTNQSGEPSRRQSVHRGGNQARKSENFYAVVGSTDSFAVVYPQTGAVRGYFEICCAENGREQFGPGRSCRQRRSGRKELTVTACVEAETGSWVSGIVVGGRPSWPQSWMCQIHPDGWRVTRNFAFSGLTNGFPIFPQLMWKPTTVESELVDSLSDNRRLFLEEVGSTGASARGLARGSGIGSRARSSAKGGSSDKFKSPFQGIRSPCRLTLSRRYPN